MKLDFEDFKKMYAETMMYYQEIEHDVKLIYAFMLSGDVDENIDDIETITLGQMINRLRDLDYSDDKPYISKEDYNFLSQICKNRNHWAHMVFIKFMYIPNWFSSSAYLKQCDELISDHERVKRASQILENIRVEYCTKHKR
ncbi:MAG: hypothetical protein J5691_05680 [Bacilli bacterium]|nr:hypothetical protein [Bacilli bacterium]